MRILRLILCVGLSAVPFAAKLKVVVGVDVSDERIRSEIKAGIAARFNSTERYTTTESFTDNDIFLHVICVPVKLKNATYNLAQACAADARYYPFKNSLSYPLAETSSIVITGPENLQGMINGFVDDLINATTDEKLAEYRKTITSGVQLVCLSEPGICKLPPPKE